MATCRTSSAIAHFLRRMARMRSTSACAIASSDPIAPLPFWAPAPPFTGAAFVGASVAGGGPCPAAGGAVDPAAAAEGRRGALLPSFAGLGCSVVSAFLWARQLRREWAAGAAGAGAG